jgi:CubicO group peptidase (beta-lactamase class C family)
MPAMLEQISDRMNRAVEENVFPGAVVLVAYQGKIVFHEAFGSSRIIPQKVPMTRGTLFDIASLTKPVAAGTACMLLVQRGLLKIEDPVHKIVPEFGNGEKEKVKIFHLLTHSSGFRAWRPLYKEVSPEAEKRPDSVGDDETRKKIYELVHREPLSYSTATQSLYSDLNFILLGEIVERLTGMRLDQFFDKETSPKFKLAETFYLPWREKISKTRLQGKIVAATEDCPWRKEILMGVVEDENAYALGGVSGHAGLFSTVSDLYRFLEVLLAADSGDASILPPKLVRLFLDRNSEVPKSSWALGWDTPSAPSSSGQFFPSRSFGHLGYSGTSIWADRDKKLVVILLTNRVHPTRKNDKIKKFRPEIHDLIYKTVTNG